MNGVGAFPEKTMIFIYMYEKNRVHQKDFFLQFFPENLVERLVTETNNYAKRMTEEKPDTKWTETNLTEMWDFLGIFMIFSIMQVPKYSIASGVLLPFLGYQVSVK